MTNSLLPPSFTLHPTRVGVAVLTDSGVTVEVSLPRAHALHDKPDPEIVEQARQLAKQALVEAARTL